MADLPSFTLDEIPALLESPDFHKQDADTRAQVVEHALATSYAGLQQSGSGMTAEDYKAFREVGDLARSKAGSTVGEKAWSAAKFVPETLYGMGKDLAAGFAGLAMGQAQAINPLNPSADLLKTQGAAVVHHVKDRAASITQAVDEQLPHGRALDSVLGEIKSRIDNGEHVTDAMALLQDVAPKLEAAQAGWKRLPFKTDDKGRVTRDTAPGLDDPEAAMDFHRYAATGDPSAWKDFRSKIFKSDFKKRTESEARAMLDSPGAKKFESVFGAGAAEHLVAGSDPLLWGTLAAPVLRGEAAVGAVAPSAAKAAARTGAEMSAFGADAALRENPDATLGDVAASSAKMIALGAALHGGSWLARKGLDSLRKPEEAAATPPSVEPAPPPEVAPADAPLNVPADFQRAAPPVVEPPPVEVPPVEVPPVEVPPVVEPVPPPAEPVRTSSPSAVEAELEAKLKAARDDGAAADAEAAARRAEYEAQFPPLVEPAPVPVEAPPVEPAPVNTPALESPPSPLPVEQTAPPPLPSALDTSAPIPAPSSPMPSVVDAPSSVQYPQVPHGSQAPYEGPTSIRNAVVDSEREARGLPPMMEPARREWGTAWDEASARLDQNPLAGVELVAELNKESRPLKDADNALLLQHKLAVRWQVDSAVDRLNDPAADAATKQTARADLARHLDALNDIDNAGKLAGTDLGRGLNARKMMAGDAEFFNESAMLAREQAMNGGEPLTEPEIKAVQKQAAKIEQTRKAVEDHYEKQADKEASEAVAGILEDYQLELKDAADAALARIQKRAERSANRPKNLKPTDGLPENPYTPYDLVDMLRDEPMGRPPPRRMDQRTGDKAKDSGHHDALRRWSEDDPKTYGALTEAGSKNTIENLARDAYRNGEHGLVDDSPETFLAKLHEDMQARRNAGRNERGAEKDMKRQEADALAESRPFERAQKAAMNDAADAGVPLDGAATNFFKEAREAAERRLKENRGKLFSDVFGAQVFRTTLDHTIIGASYIAEAGLDFVKWSGKMLEKFGDRIKPHLEPLFERSKSMFEQTRADFHANAEARARAASPAGVMDAAKRSMLAGKMDAMKLDPKLARDLVIAHVAAGAKTLKEVIALVHADVIKFFPEMTPREVRDAFSAYGKVRKPTADAIRAQVREMGVQARLQSAFEDALRGRNPRASGLHMGKPSETVRKMREQLRDVMRKMQIPIGREEHLATARGVVINRLKNQIRDIDLELAGEIGPRKPREPLEYTPAMNRLKRQRDDMAAYLADLTGPDAGTKWNQRAEKAAKASAENYRRRVAQRDLDTRRGVPHATTERTAAALKERAAAKAEFDAMREAAGLPQADALAAVKRSLVKRAEDIRARLAGGAAPESGRPPVLDAEARRLKAEMVDLKAALREFEGPRAANPARLAEAAERATLKAIETIETELRTGKEPARKAPGFIPDAKLRALQAELASLREVRDAAREAKTPRRTDEELSLAALKKRLATNTKKLNDKLARGDFSKRTPKEIKLDDEAMKLTAEHERAKLDYRRGVKAKELAGRTTGRKLGDHLQKWQRGFILSGITTLGKLATAAFYRIASTPLEEAAGAAIGRIPGWSRRIAERARFEGGLHMKAEIKALTEGFMKGVREAGQVIRTGKGEIDLNFGKTEMFDLDRSVMDFFGHLHAAFKNPIKNAEFSRRFTKGLEWEARHGADPTEPAVQMRVAHEAYTYAKRSIFMNDNAVAGAINGFFGQLENAKTNAAAGYAAAKLGRMILPIVRIPTNYVAETANYALGVPRALLRDLPKVAVRGARELGLNNAAALKQSLRDGTLHKQIALAMRRGLDTMKPEEADAILRHLKKGSLGAGMVAYGFFSPQSVGGYYTDGEKRAAGDVHHGTFEVFGLTVPHWAAHAPPLEAMQMGATMRRVLDHMNSAGRHHRKAQGEKGITEMAAAAGFGLLEQVPALSAAERITDLISADARGDYARRELVKSLLVPRGVGDLAKFSDWGNDRQSSTLAEHLAASLPGFRQTLPLKQSAH